MPGAIMDYKALWDDAGKPVEVWKNSSRRGAQDADAAARFKWEVRVKLSFCSNACMAL